MEADSGPITHLVLISPHPSPSLQVSGPSLQMTGHSETKAPSHPALSSALRSPHPILQSGAEEGYPDQPEQRGQLFPKPNPSFAYLPPHPPTPGGGNVQSVWTEGLEGPWGP